MTVQEKALTVLENINKKIEEGRMLRKVFPKLDKNMWFYEQIEKLVDLAIECEKILEKAGMKETSTFKPNG